MQVDNQTVRSGAVVPMVAVLSNPKSTTNASGMEPVRQLVKESANIVHFELDSMDSIDEALALFARANPNLLIINGGDGTIGAVLGALLHRNPFSIVPPIAIVPGGKTNMTAADIGAKGKREVILSKLLQIVRTGELQDRLVTRNMIELDLGDGTEPRVGTFFGAAGVVKAIFWCRENAYAHGMPNWMAHAWTFSSMIMAMMGVGKNKQLFISDPLTIKTKSGEEISGRFSVVLVSTLEKLLLGFRPFGDRGLGGLKFSAVKPGARNIMRGILGLLNGRYQRDELECVDAGRSDILEIRSTDPVTLDGEMYVPEEGQVFTLRGSKSLTFVRL